MAAATYFGTRTLKMKITQRTPLAIAIAFSPGFAIAGIFLATFIAKLAIH